MYNFTSFAMVLNEVDKEMESVIPKTDCRLRPDIRAMENGEIGEKTAIWPWCPGPASQGYPLKFRAFGFTFENLRSPLLKLRFVSGAPSVNCTADGRRWTSQRALSSFKLQSANFTVYLKIPVVSPIREYGFIFSNTFNLKMGT